MSFISSDMLIGMLLGMAASPLMMWAFKEIKRRIKVNRILREVAELNKNRNGQI